MGPSQAPRNLLQVRTKVLNDQLRESFVRWYPGMQTEQGDRNSEERGVAPGLKYCPLDLILVRPKAKMRH